MRKKKIGLILLLLSCSSCAIFRSDPAGELNAAQISFESVVRSLTILRRENKFDEIEADHITGLIHSTEALLIQWEEVIFIEKRKPEYRDFRAFFDPMIRELITYTKER